MTHYAHEYRVKYPRTQHWWTGEWRDISNWCYENIGPSKTSWDYIGNEFVFKTEASKILFLLRWT